MKRWLKRQWRESLAADIWNDLTPFGRLTIWIPLWLVCWIAMPFVLAVAALVFFAFWLSDRAGLKRFPPIFFK